MKLKKIVTKKKIILEEMEKNIIKMLYLLLLEINEIIW
jgi:hypothetical protein